MHWYIFLVIQLLLIYATSRYVMHQLFFILHRTIRSTSVSFYILSLLYLPGTVVHELSHVVTSIALFVTPHNLNLIPSVTEEDMAFKVRFGQVEHAKTDPLRSILIGLSPLAAGFAFFYGIYVLQLFPHTNLLVNVVFIYLFFSISSTMFSSKQDLHDGLVLIPIILLAIAVVIGFKIDLAHILLSESSLQAIEQINSYLYVPVITNSLIFITLFLLRKKH